MIRVVVIALVLGACVEIDTPLPVDGQHYLCSVIDSADGTTRFEVDRCGLWDGGKLTAEQLGAELECAGLGGYVDVWCQGTRRPCDYDEPEPVVCEEPHHPPCILVCGSLPVTCDDNGCSCGSMKCEPTGIPPLGGS